MPITPFAETSPLLKLGFGGLTLNTGNPPPAGENLTVYDSSGADLGAVHISANASDLVGINSAQFTIQGITPNLDAIETALADSGIDFSNADFTADDLAGALYDSTYPDFDGNLTASDINIALIPSDITLDGSGIDPDDVAAALNGIDVPDDLPVDGTVYSFTNLGGGFANVYVAVPNADGTAAQSITDTLVTPFGNVDVPTMFDAIAFLAPGGAFAPLADGAGDFSIDGMTFDPGADGWDSIQPLIGVAPLLQIGGGYLEKTPGDFAHLATQDFAVSDASGADLGTVTTGVNSLNLLGLIQSTELTVTNVTADGGGDTAGLPAEGTVYSVTNLGGGFYNVYQAVPNADGDAAGSIQDTFVTPFGSFEVPTEFDAIAALNPGSAIDDLSALDAGDIGSDNAFTIGDITFDPGAGGFDALYPVFGIAPLMQLGGGDLQIYDLATQNLTLYGDAGADLGAISTGVQVANILGIENTQFTVGGIYLDGSDFEGAIADSGVDLDSADADAVVTGLLGLPAIQTAINNGQEITDGLVLIAAIQQGVFLSSDDQSAIADALNDTVAEHTANMPMPTGTVYDVLNLGGGFANLYVAVPGDDGATTSITDTLITPWGNWDILTDFDATTPLDPADAVAGVSTAGGAAADAAAGAFDLFDPSTWF